MEATTAVEIGAGVVEVVLVLGLGVEVVVVVVGRKVVVEVVVVVVVEELELVLGIVTEVVVGLGAFVVVVELTLLPAVLLSELSDGNVGKSILTLLPKLSSSSSPVLLDFGEELSILLLLIFASKSELSSSSSSSSSPKPSETLGRGEVLRLLFNKRGKISGPRTRITCPIIRLAISSICYKTHTYTDILFELTLWVFTSLGRAVVCSKALPYYLKQLILENTRRACNYPICFL